jgi:hypothetical protein
LVDLPSASQWCWCRLTAPLPVAAWISQHHEEVVDFCVWCSHVYVSYDAKTEAQHLLYFCSGAPAEIRKAEQPKLARLDYRHRRQRIRHCRRYSRLNH